MSGCILYRGPSLLDGRKVVCVATGLGRQSHNAKTGPMIQTYILTDGNLDPVASRQRGRDASVCGDCPHRGRAAGGAGTCYVNLGQAPLAIWRALRAGAYPRFSPALAPLFRGRALRLGSYGEPAAVPLRVWTNLARLVASWLGYTHQWRTCNQRLRRYCMASCDTAADRAEAVAKGWRTFRVRRPDEPLLPGEFSCPASAEEKKRLTCAQCRACGGVTSSPRAACPSIVFHGPALAGNWRLRRFEGIQRAGALSLPVIGETF